MYLGRVKMQEETLGVPVLVCLQLVLILVSYSKGS